MGIRATISKIETDGTVHTCYIHWAQPKDVGIILHQCFGTEDEVGKLINFGHLDSIDLIKGKPEDYPKSYKDAEFFGQIVVLETDHVATVANGFIRIRQYGETYSPADIHENYQKFREQYYDKERDFVYINGKWWMSSKDFGNFLPMETVIELLQVDQPVIGGEQPEPSDNL